MTPWSSNIPWPTVCVHLSKRFELLPRVPGIRLYKHKGFGPLEHSVLELHYFLLCQENVSYK